MLKCNGKTFMNLQEAVQWLLNNNALPFQCKVAFVADTPIGLDQIINPSPVQVKIGSLILFSDGKVGTVTEVTEDEFTVGSDYAQIDAVGIANMDLDAQGNLVVTLTDGTVLTAGNIKEVSGFSIDASQHLVVSYNDGTSQDLGPIFQGTVNISGNFTADSIIENMSGYSASLYSQTDYTLENIYTGAVKNGNKLTLVAAVNITRLNNVSSSFGVVEFTVPDNVYSKLYPTAIGGYTLLNFPTITAVATDASKINVGVLVIKTGSDGKIRFAVHTDSVPGFVLNKKYYLRVEVTFLLGNSLI